MGLCRELYMVDLLTHYFSARIPGGFIGDDCARTTLALGVFLPDLVGKGIEAIPGMPHPAWAPAHSLVGIVLVSMTLAMLFSREFRFKAFTTLLIGQALHLALDVGKESMGSGSIFLLLPFSLDGYDLGFYTSQDVYWFLPANLLVLAALWYLGRKARQRGWIWR